MTLVWEQVQEAVGVIHKAASIRPTVGVILGSGLGSFASQVEKATVLDYGEIPHFPKSGVVGHAGELVLGNVHGVPCALMRGRVHHYEGHEMSRVTFAVRVLRALGCKTLLVTNAAGGINPVFRPGDLMALCDHINLTGVNPLRGPNDERFGPRFPDMTEPYDALVRERLHEAALAVGVTLREGIYAGVAGPSFETPAEVRMLHRLGADAVGMSTVGEVIVARHMGLRVGGISMITNQAAGIAASPLTHEEVTALGEARREDLGRFLAGAIVRMG